MEGWVGLWRDMEGNSKRKPHLVFLTSLVKLTLWLYFHSHPPLIRMAMFCYFFFFFCHCLWQSFRIEYLELLWPVNRKVYKLYYSKTIIVKQDLFLPLGSSSLWEDYTSCPIDIRFSHTTCVTPSCRGFVHPYPSEIRSTHVNFFGQWNVGKSNACQYILTSK